MSSYYLAPIAGNSQIDTAGAPLSGGFIYTYLPGTTTNVATYTDNTGGTAQTNPIVLNTYGLPPSPVWLLGGQAVKFVIKDALGNTIRTIDPIWGIDDPTFATGRLLNVQVFTASGTYTPTAGTTAVIVKVQAGGGAGGGAAATAAGQVASGGGGGAGGYATSRLTTGFSGATVTVGAAGAGASGAVGGNGGSSSFGALLSATGGTGGTLGGIVASGAASFVVGGNGGVGTGGNIVNSQGQPGLGSLYVASVGLSGSGGASVFGGGANGLFSASNGVDANSYGAGGSGASNPASSAAKTGGAGKAGIVIVEEYA